MGSSGPMVRPSHEVRDDVDARDRLRRACRAAGLTPAASPQPASARRRSPCRRGGGPSRQASRSLDEGGLGFVLADDGYQGEPMTTPVTTTQPTVALAFLRIQVPPAVGRMLLRLTGPPSHKADRSQAAPTT